MNITPWMFVLFKNIQGGELNIIGQSKAMRLNMAETCTDSNGASEASTSEEIEHFNLFTIFTQMLQIILKINAQNLSEQSSGEFYDSTTLPKLILNNLWTLPKLPAQANICRLLRLLDFGLVSEHITFSGDKNNPWTLPKLPAQANIYRLFRLLDKFIKLWNKQQIISHPLAIFFHSTTCVKYYSIFPKFLKIETHLLNLFTTKYFILSWKHNFKRWSIFSWNKSRSTCTSCCFFKTFFPYNTLLRNQFESTISTTHQQLLNQLK